MKLLALLGVTLAASAVAAEPAAQARGAQQPDAQSPPNVVVIMTDDQTVESMRIMRNVNRFLADRGTTFVNNFATYSLCCPSRSTYLTGQYAHTHGIMSNTPPLGGYDKLEPTHANTLPNWLRRAGYRTVHIGKYLNGYTRDDGIPVGWSEWYGAVDPSTYQYYGYTLNENGTFVTYGSAPSDYQSDVYTQKAVAVINRLAPRAQPFFLSVAYLAPHSGRPQEPGDPVGFGTPVPAPRHSHSFDDEPLPMPASFNEADVSDKPSFIRERALLTAPDIANITENYRQRLEALLAVDEGVAAIVQALAARGELAGTLIIFTSDNGFFHGEHRVPREKVLLYEPSIRTPLILRGPGVPRGAVRPQLVGNIDLAPTILDAANARAGRRMDGRSLLPLIANPGIAWRDEIVIENATSRGMRGTDFMFATHDTGEQELYDLSADPDQLVNLAQDARFTAVRERMAGRLKALRLPPMTQRQASMPAMGIAEEELTSADTNIAVERHHRSSQPAAINRMRP
jgi:N-acetylglucosamine-6-sulfatase